MPFDFKAVNLACDINGYVNANLERCGLGCVYSGWYGFWGINIFRKIPNGLRDVFQGSREDVSLKSTRGWSSRVGAVET